MNLKLQVFVSSSQEGFSHFKRKKEGNFFLRFLLLIFWGALVSCNTESPQPELKDPIYKDLLQEQKRYEDLTLDTQAKFQKLEAERKKLEARTVKSSLNRKNFHKLKEQHRKYAQKAKYYKLRAFSRLKEARKSYKKAFKERKPWPSPEEYRIYLIKKKLKNAPRKWSSSRSSSMTKESSEKGKPSSH